MRFNRLLSTLALLVSVLSHAVPSQAQESSWTDLFPGNSNVSNNLNWAGNVAPPNDGSHTWVFRPFSGAGGPFVDAPWSVKGIRTQASPIGPNFTFFGSSLTIGSAGLELVEGTGTFFPGVTLTFNQSLILSADQTWLADEALTSNASVDLNGRTLTVDGTAGVYLNGEIANPGTIEKRGPGTLSLTPDSANSWGGILNVIDGRVRLGAATGPAVNGLILLGAGGGAPESDVVELLGDDQMGPTVPVIMTRTGLLEMSTYDDAVGDLEMSGAKISSTGGELALHGDLTAYDTPDPNVIEAPLRMTGTQTIDVRDGAPADDLSIGQFRGNTPSLNVTKAGPGVLNLTGEGNFDGLLDVKEGTLRVTTPGGNATIGASLSTRIGAVLEIDTQNWEAGLDLEALLVVPGSTLNWSSGRIRVTAGAAEFPTDSMVLGTAPTGPVAIPNFELHTGATAQVRYAWVLGDVAGSTAATTVTGAISTRPSTLSNFGGGGGADLIVGDEGIGLLSVLDGGRVTFNDDLRLAVADGSGGSLVVRGRQQGHAATAEVVGANAEIELGRRGAANVDLEEGGVIDSSTDILVSGISGYCNIQITDGPSGFPCTLRAADDIILGGTESAEGGIANLVSDDAIVGAGDLFKLWPASSFLMIRGSLRAARLDLAPDRYTLSGTIVSADAVLSDLDLGTGWLEPGDVTPRVGTTSVDGNLTLNPAGGLGLDIEATGYDRIGVNGEVALAGTLAVRLLDGVVPRPGTTYPFLTAQNIVGDFDAVEVEQIPGFYVTLERTATTLTLRVLNPVGLPETPDVASAFGLEQNHPNPFNPSTTIEFSIPADDHVRLDIFNLAGRRVAVLLDAPQAAGRHRVEWNGRDAAGHLMASGPYFYRLRSAGQTTTRRMTLLK